MLQKHQEKLKEILPVAVEVNNISSTPIVYSFRLSENDTRVMLLKRDTYGEGRLTTRPNNLIGTNKFKTSVQSIKLNAAREQLFYVPVNYSPHSPAALAVMLHGAGGDVAHGLSLLRSFADERNIILLAPASKEYSWDIIASHSFGTDVALIDTTLSFLFSHYAINANHVGIGGFSDGASYALCIGLGNGDLFTHVLALLFIHKTKPWHATDIYLSWNRG